MEGHKSTRVGRVFSLITIVVYPRQISLNPSKDEIATVDLHALSCFQKFIVNMVLG